MFNASGGGAIERALAELEDEHRTLGELVERLEGTGDRPGVAAALDAMQDFLEEHFAHEELEGGLYAQLGTGARDLRAHVQELVYQHVEIRSMLQIIRRDARRGEGDLSATRRRVRELLEKLRHHEELEMNMASLALEREQGRHPRSPGSP